MQRGHRGRGVGLGVVLLAHRMLTAGRDTLLPVTLITIIAQTLLYLDVVERPWGRWQDVCLSGASVVQGREYQRLVLAALEHTDDIHLYHNMASFLLKAPGIERREGSVRLLILLVVLTLTTSLAYVCLVCVAAHYLHDNSYMHQCAVGFSGVLFALKVVTTEGSGSSHHYVHGVRVPAKLSVWVELLIIHLLVPRASFVGHLAGILVGLAYVYGPIRFIVDAIHGLFVGPRPSYTYMHGTARPYYQDGYEEPNPEELRWRRTQHYNHEQW